MNYNSETINKLYYGDRLINISVTNGSGGDNALIKSIKIEDFTGTTFNRSTSYITSVTIPSGVTSIGEYTFQGCTSLTSVTVLATTPPSIAVSAFNNTNDCPIYVPADSVSSYKSSWIDYASRIQAIPNS